MYKIKKYIFAISIMIIVAMLSLLVVSVLTYLLKWHADKAMVGIIVTYVLTGYVGGFCLSRYEKRRMAIDKPGGIGKKAVETLLLSGVFMLLLVGISVLGMKGVFEISIRFLVILTLLVCSTFLGRIL